jgi:hypothetical protein
MQYFNRLHKKTPETDIQGLLPQSETSRNKITRFKRKITSTQLKGNIFGADYSKSNRKRKLMERKAAVIK